MGLVYGDPRRVIAMKGNGWIIDSTDKELSNIEIVLTRASSKTFLNMVEDRKLLSIGTDMLVSINLANPMEKEPIPGTKEDIMRENSNKDFVMAKANISKPMATSTQVNHKT